MHRYVRDLEEVMIRVCADYGVAAARLAGLTAGLGKHTKRGLEKIAAIGVRPWGPPAFPPPHPPSTTSLSSGGSLGGVGLGVVEDLVSIRGRLREVFDSESHPHPSPLTA